MFTSMHESTPHQQPSPSPTMAFPAPHIHQPEGTHTHTIVLLHGRGSNGPEFAEELFSSTTSNGQNLASRLPNYRWVFPTSRDRWSTTFQEEMSAWFDVYSLTDIQQRRELQKEGLCESILQILEILETEIAMLNGKVSRIYLGGMSQGMATALWVFLAAMVTGRVQGPLGGLLGFCGWLPFAHQLEDRLDEATIAPGASQIGHLIRELFLDEIADDETFRTEKEVDASLLSTPVFLSHGADDAWVSVELGQQAFRVSQKMMSRVEWNEHTGAENDGHWIKEPEGFDQIVQFLESTSI